MKKTISIIAILSLLALGIFTGKTYAASLDAINVTIDKTTVRPEEEVKVTVEFGQSLGAYTFDIAYDNSIFEYVSAEGGTPNDTTDKVRVVFHDTTGGTNPRTNMSVTFKAKTDITTSNPTEFTITGEGLSNADASITYDDITTPIVKNVTVEPQYVDYTLTLEPTGDIIKGEENAMKLSYFSSMGRYYQHARLIAQATTPNGANIKLTGTDDQGLEHDIIQSGWGDAQGYSIGGKDVSQTLQVRGLFSEVGDYTITLQLIDRDNSDTVFAQNTFNFTVLAEQTTPANPDASLPAEPEQPQEPQEVTVINEEETPKQLPKTGINIYIPIIGFLIVILFAYVYMNRKTK